MKKTEFETKINGQCHESLYIKNDSQITYEKGKMGCLKNGRQFTVYTINNEALSVSLGSYNNEEDAYELLDQIFDDIHHKIANRLINKYNIRGNRELPYYINKLINTDIVFARELERRGLALTKKRRKK